MKRIRASLIAAAIALLTAAGVDPAVAAEPSPSFVLFLADDLGYGDVEINGASVARTPNLARLAAEGIRLTSFYAAANWCMPTRASILTASYPKRIGLAQGSDTLTPGARRATGLADTEITLPELLRGAGYATALIGKWHLGDQPALLPTRHGFDRFFGLLHPNDAGREGFLRWGAMRRDTGYFPLALLRDEAVVEAEPDQSLLTRRYTDEAIRFLEASRDRPFFLFLSYSMPHKPAHASAAFTGSSSGGVYGDSVQEIDASVGDVLATLERLGLDQRTLVVFTSDNGAGRGWGSNAPLRGWKKTTLEGGMRVPFAARWPGQTARGATSDQLVATMDLMPTFARLAGVELPKDRSLDGHDVWPLLAGEPGARSPRESFLYYDGGRLEGVRDARYKLWFGREPPAAPAGSPGAMAESDGGGRDAKARPPGGVRVAPATPVLYDLAADVAETTDVASAHPDVVERLTALVAAARADLGDAATGVEGKGTRAPGLVESPRPMTDFVTVRDQPPVVPVGLDAYRMWERWPYQRIGVRAYMRSTYDRTGGNHTADASHFLYQEADDFNVTLDVLGQGVLYFARYNHWHGSPWHYEVDGKDHIVQETSTADPRNPNPESVFLPEAAFPPPLTWTWSTTKGADLSWVPIPFEQSFRMAYSRTFYGTGYYIYHQFVDGTPLSRPIESWNAEPPGSDVLELIGRAGSDIAPAAGSGGVIEDRGVLAHLGAGETKTIWSSDGGPRAIRAFELSVPENAALDFSTARLRVTWDDREHASIDAPVALFFGAGILYNRDQREYLVKSFPNVIQYAGDRVHLRCYFPMPFFRSARVELVGAGTTATDVRFAVRHAPFLDPPHHAGYFHATYRDHPHPEIGHDLVLLDTREVEGGGDWSGSFVGTTYTFSHDAVLNTLEGDPRFFFDDSQTPQAQGTGSEEWGGGGDYWGGRTMTLPFAGHPVGAARPEEAKDEYDEINSAYRFLLADLMPFGKNAVIRLEHGATNLSTEHYETVTYWYGLPAPSLVQTDQLDVGDLESERAHGYTAPAASEPYELVSRYELGVDTLERTPDRPPFSGEGREVYPAHAEVGRWTKGTSDFTMRVDPRNVGVMLRRQLDYSLPDQRANVYVAAVSGAAAGGADAGDAAAADWQLAGVWYLAGSNMVVYSYPPDRDELGATLHTVEISNRRFRDDEFLIPRRLTEGKSSIRVRIEPTPIERPLFPQLAARRPRFTAWSELRYTAYSVVMPAFEP